MTFYIVKDGTKTKGTILFLIDRTRNTTKWWTKNLNAAVQFKKIKVAQMSIDRLSFGNPKIVTELEAQEIDKNQRYEDNIRQSKVTG